MSEFLERVWSGFKETPYRKRVLIITIAVIIGTLSIFVTTRLARMLQHKEMNEMALWSYAMERMGESTHNDPLVFQVIHNQKIPYILLDESGRVEKYHLLPESVVSPPDKRMKLMLRLSRQNTPIEITTPRGYRYILFYGNSALLDWLIIFPYLQLGVGAIFVFFALMTGASPSVCRAAVMQVLVLCAPLARREVDSATTLAAPALLLLIESASILLNVFVTTCSLITPQRYDK